MPLLRKRFFVSFLSVCVLVGTHVSQTYASSPVAINEAVVVMEERAQQKDYLQQALQQVFVKMSGFTSVLEHPSVQRSVANYEQYLIRSRTQQSDDELLLTATFNKEKISNILNSLQLPVWPELRPSAVVWLGFREGSGFDFASEINFKPFGKALVNASNKRGVHFLLPVGDINDLETVTGYDVWSQNISRLARQSGRYQSDNFISLSINQATPADIESANLQIMEEYQLRLITAQSMKTDRMIIQSSRASSENRGEGLENANIEDNSLEEESLGLLHYETVERPEIVPEDADLRIDFVIVTPEETVTGQLFGEEPLALIERFVDKYADDLARRYAVISAPQQSAMKVGITFKNVGSLQNLTEVERLLTSNPMIRTVFLKTQKGNISTFEVELTDEVQKLTEILTIDSRVKTTSLPISIGSGDESIQAQLAFRWEP